MNRLFFQSIWWITHAAAMAGLKLPLNETPSTVFDSPYELSRHFASSQSGHRQWLMIGFPRGTNSPINDAH